MKNLLLIFSLRPALKSRLETAINAIEIELKFRKTHSQIDHTLWADHVESALLKAKEALDKKDIDQGWNYVHLADEYLIWGMNEGEITSKAKALRVEASKIGGSKGDAILKILGEEGHTVANVELQEALSIRNEHYSTKYHKINLRKASLYSLSWLLTLIVFAGIAWIAFLQGYWETKKLSFQLEAISGLFMGLLGASFSLAYTMTSSPIDVKIPDQIMGAMITVIRLAIGGTASFIALLILKTEMLEALLSEKLLTGNFGFLVIAFIAGFSERWIVNVIQVISKEPEKNNNINTT